MHEHVCPVCDIQEECDVAAWGNAEEDCAYPQSVVCGECRDEEEEGQ